MYFYNDCKYMKIIYEHCGWRNEYRSDPRNYEHRWTSNWNKAWKKIQARTRYSSGLFLIFFQLNPV